MPCILVVVVVVVVVSQRLEGIYCLHVLQGRRRGGSRFLRNADNRMPNRKTPHPKRRQSSAVTVVRTSNLVYEVPRVKLI